MNIDSPNEVRTELPKPPPVQRIEVITSVQRRRCWSGGSDRTKILFGGVKQSVVRPCVRSADGKVELETLRKLQDQDIFDEDIRDKRVLGASSRNYYPLIEKWSDKLSISKSNISRSFIRASKKNLEKINTQNLAEYEFIAIMIDGVEIAGRSLIVVLRVSPTTARKCCWACVRVIGRTQLSSKTFCFKSASEILKCTPTGYLPLRMMQRPSKRH